MDATDPDLDVPALGTCCYRHRPPASLLVRTSLGAPRWYPNQGRDLPTCWPITPRGGYLDADPEAFEDAYLSQLRRHGVHRIAAHFRHLAATHNTDQLWLACFEPDRADCHRGTFADWWTHETGQDVPEYQPRTALNDDPTTQPSRTTPEGDHAPTTPRPAPVRDLSTPGGTP